MKAEKDGVEFVFFSSRRRHTRYWRDWSSDVCSSDLWTAFVLWLYTSQPQPLPCIATVSFENLSLKSLNLPNVLLIASESSASGSPPPPLFILFQNSA